MFRKLLSKLVGKVVKNPVIAHAIADELDRKAKRELDKRTGGLASKIDDVV